MTRRRDEAALKYIIRQLETLECNELETLEESWVRSVLVSPGRPRQNLMMWVLTRLCPAEASLLPTVLPQMQSQRILEILSCMGVCQPGDSDVIEGTAPEAAQLKFWSTCVDSIKHLCHLSQPMNQQHVDAQAASLLLYHLAHSPHLQPTLKEGGISVVPGDLREKYQAWCKQKRHIPVSESLKEVQEQLGEEQERYKAVEERNVATSEEHQSLQASIKQALCGLTKEQELLQGVYSSYIAPWTASNTQLELSHMGPLVEETNDKLTSLTKAVKATEETLQLCEQLEEQEKAILKHSSHPSAITSTLHSLVSQPGQAKLSLDAA